MTRLHKKTATLVVHVEVPQPSNSQFFPGIGQVGTAQAYICWVEGMPCSGSNRCGAVVAPLHVPPLCRPLAPLAVFPTLRPGFPRARCPGCNTFLSGPCVSSPV